MRVGASCVRCGMADEKVSVFSERAPGDGLEPWQPGTLVRRVRERFTGVPARAFSLKHEGIILEAVTEPVNTYVVDVGYQIQRTLADLRRQSVTDYVRGLRKLGEYLREHCPEAADVLESFDSE